eukprot:2878452-Rhodomonas_salina.1
MSDASTSCSSAPALTSSSASSALSSKLEHHSMEREFEDFELDDDNDEEWLEFIEIGARLFMGTPGHITALYVRQQHTLETLMGNMHGFKFQCSLSFRVRMDIDSMKNFIRHSSTKSSCDACSHSPCA